MQVQVIEIAIGKPNEKEASSVTYVLDADVAVKWLQSFGAHKMRGGTYKRVEGRRRFNVDLNAKDIAEQLKDDSLYYEYGKQNTTVFWVNLNPIDICTEIKEDRL